VALSESFMGEESSVLNDKDNKLTNSSHRMSVVDKSYNTGMGLTMND